MPVPPAFRLLFATLVACAAAGPSSAQLPNVGQTVGGVVGQTQQTIGNVATGVASGVQDTTQRLRNDLRGVRADRLTNLRRQHPDLIDIDRNGAAVIRSQVLAIAPSAEALTAAQAHGFTVAERSEQTALGLNLVTLRAPNGMSTRRAVEMLRRLDPSGAYDYDHLYLGAGAGAVRADFASVQSGAGASNARIGLIDGGVDPHHPALASLSIRQRAFAGAESADPHGTAVASLLAGDGAGFRGAAPGASLYVADVYGGSPTGGGAAAIVAALNWLAEQRVAVINISLVGPSNRALEAGVRAMVDRGFVIVAAVGNDGPSAPPLYPASYPGVVGVTGVDARNRALPEAARGAQVDWAAPGSDMLAAEPGGGFAGVRGTSFAAPIVAGLMAQSISAPSPQAATRAQTLLAGAALDLGAHGRDPVFGQGLVGGDVRVAPARVARR
ncbi:MAG TPA: S8 family serine peptidase [Caulobacterales bacterium]|nr:S8 family serine peptidase [Caulobacterales bacterium]